MRISTEPFISKVRRTLVTGIGTLVMLFSINIWPSSNEPLTLYLPSINQSEANLAKRIEAEFRNQGLRLFRVRGTRFWHPFQNGIRSGKKGIYFAQPHMAAWAISKHNFEPVFRLHGRLNFVLAATKTNTKLFELEDLNGEVICHESGLNLGKLWLEQVLGEYQIAANRREVTNVELATQDTEESQKCDAFVLENLAYERANKAARGKYIRLAQSRFYKHNVFIAHPELTSHEKLTFKKALKSAEMKELLKPYLLTLSKWDNLVEVSEEDYSKEESSLLEPYWVR